MPVYWNEMGLGRILYILFLELNHINFREFRSFLQISIIYCLAFIKRKHQPHANMILRGNHSLSSHIYSYNMCLILYNFTCTYIVLYIYLYNYTYSCIIVYIYLYNYTYTCIIVNTPSLIITCFYIKYTHYVDIDDTLKELGWTHKLRSTVD